MTLSSLFAASIDSLLAALRGADAERREAEASTSDRAAAAAARAKVRKVQQDLRDAHLRQREAAIAAGNERMARLADDLAAVDEKAADLALQLSQQRDRRAVIERKITAARAARDRVSLQAAKRVTVRLDAADRLIPPPDCQLLDPAVWVALIVDGKTKGVNGAWAVDLIFDERTGQLIGDPTFHYEQTDAERRARRNQVGSAIAERRQRLNHDDPGGQLRRDAEATWRNTPR